MDYFRIVFKAIENIENNLTEEININTISTGCNMSAFHFHRVFKSITNHSIMNYVRKRKLNKACRQLIETEKKIIDISFDFNYESNEAFTRAVKKDCGFTPSQIRKQKLTNIGIDKMPAWGMRYEKNYGKEKLDYEIIVLDKLLLAGVSTKMTLEDDKNYVEVGKIVKELNDLKKNIKNRKDIEVNREFGIAFDTTLDLKNPHENKFMYYRAVEIEKKVEMSKNITIKEFNSIKCAKFYVGSSFEDHKKALDYIYGIWLLETSFELNRDTFDFMEEIIKTSNGNKHIFFYIPIK